MLKLTYIAVFLIGTSFIACEKKNAAPSKTTTPPPVVKDTLSGKIYTIAGNGSRGDSGNGGPAKAAELNYPNAVAVDASGNVYIVDLYNECIRKVNTNGIISTIVGNGIAGFSGDGGLATAAELDLPAGITVDASGNIYISDQGNQRIRKVNINGIISTIAGNGTPGYSGDGGVATAAELSNPYGLAVDDSGNVYIADAGNSLIRKVNTKGIISTITGAVSYPEGVAVDSFGNVYIADQDNNRILKVNKSGIISTVAGNGYGAPFDGGYSGDGGLAINAELYFPTDVAVDGSGNMYIADADNFRIRMVNTNGIISTYAGNAMGGAYGYLGDGGAAINAEIGYIQGIALDGSGNLYLAQMYENRIRVVYK